MYKAGLDRTPEKGTHFTGYTIDQIGNDPHVRQIVVWRDMELRDAILAFLNGKWDEIPPIMHPDTTNAYFPPKTQKLTAKRVLQLVVEGNLKEVAHDRFVVLRNPDYKEDDGSNPCLVWDNHEGLGQ